MDRGLILAFSISSRRYLLRNHFRTRIIQIYHSKYSLHYRLNYYLVFYNNIMSQLMYKYFLDDSPKSCLAAENTLVFSKFNK